MRCNQDSCWVLGFKLENDFVEDVHDGQQEGKDEEGGHQVVGLTHFDFVVGWVILQ